MFEVMFEIREIDSDNEKLCNCASCNLSSAGLVATTMFEIKFIISEQTLNICDRCLGELRAKLNDMSLF